MKTSFLLSKYKLQKLRSLKVERKKLGIKAQKFGAGLLTIGVKKNIKIHQPINDKSKPPQKQSDFKNRLLITTIKCEKMKIYCGAFKI